MNKSEKINNILNKIVEYHLNQNKKEIDKAYRYFISNGEFPKTEVIYENGKIKVIPVLINSQ